MLWDLQQARLRKLSPSQFIRVLTGSTGCISSSDMCEVTDPAILAARGGSPRPNHAYLTRRGLARRTASRKRQFESHHGRLSYYRRPRPAREPAPLASAAPGTEPSPRGWLHRQGVVAGVVGGREPLASCALRDLIVPLLCCGRLGRAPADQLQCGIGLADHRHRSATWVALSGVL